MEHRKKVKDEGVLSSVGSSALVEASDPDLEASGKHKDHHRRGGGSELRIDCNVGTVVKLVVAVLVMYLVFSAIFSSVSDISRGSKHSKQRQKEQPPLGKKLPQQQQQRRRDTEDEPLGNMEDEMRNRDDEVEEDEEPDREEDEDQQEQEPDEQEEEEEEQQQQDNNDYDNKGDIFISEEDQDEEDPNCGDLTVSNLRLIHRANRMRCRIKWRDVHYTHPILSSLLSRTRQCRSFCIKARALESRSAGTPECGLVGVASAPSSSSGLASGALLYS